MQADVVQRANHMLFHSPQQANYVSPVIVTAAAIMTIVAAMSICGCLSVGTPPEWTLPTSVTLPLGFAGGAILGYKFKNYISCDSPVGSSWAKWMATALATLSVAVAVLGALIYANAFTLNTAWGPITPEAGMFSMIGGVSVLTAIVLGAITNECVKRRQGTKLGPDGQPLLNINP